MSDAPVFDVRPSTPEDLPFVYATWLQCYKRSSYFARKIKAPLFFEQHHKVIERLIARPECRISIATPAGDPHTIIGYLVVEHIGERATIHFAYTKKSFRELGAMRTLLNAAKVDPRTASFSHWTDSTDRLLPHWAGATYDPYQGFK